MFSSFKITGLASQVKIAPSYVASGATGTATAVRPTGWQTGDFLILETNSWRQDGVTPASGFNAPSGWSLLSYYDVTYSGTTTSRTKIFYRFAPSDLTDLTLTTSDGTNTYTEVRMSAFRGVNTSTPYEGSLTVSNQTASTSFAYRQVTTTGPSRLVIQNVTKWDNTTSLFSPASGWTEYAENSNFLGMALNGKSFSTAGTIPSGSMTYAGSAAVWGGAGFALIPV